METEFIERLHDNMQWILEHKYFNPVSGIVSVANPVALIPGLLAAIAIEDITWWGAVSGALMWVVFVLIQVTFALVGIKTKNLGMFISMAVSVIISLAVIAVYASKFLLS